MNDIAAPEGLRQLLADNWSLILFRGIMAILFGIIAWSWPGLTVLMLVIMWGVYAAIDGILALLAGAKGSGPLPRWFLVLAGVVSIGAAIFCIARPGMTALFLIMLIGWWSIIRGIFEIAGAVALRKEIENEWWLILNGVLSLLFGIFILVRPGAGALALIWLIAIFSIIIGVSLVLLALRLRKLQKSSVIEVEAEPAGDA